MKKRIILDVNNEFIERHATDSLYKKIVSELTTRNEGNTTGNKLMLTPKMLRDFLFYVSMGADLKDAATSVHLEEKTRQDYNRRSEAFSGVTNLAKNNVSLRSRMTVAQSIMGRKPSYYKLIHPVTNQPTYIELKEIEPDVRVAMWWLEKVDKIGIEEQDEDPFKNAPMGCPQNEHEVELQKQLMAWYYDYVISKEKEAKEKVEQEKKTANS